MASCGQLKRGMAAPCEPASGGLQTKNVLIPKEFITGVVRNAAQRKAVVITLATGKKGFLFEGLAESNVARATYAPTKYGGRYTHEVDMANFANTAQNLETVEDLAKTPVVSIIKGNDNLFKIFGLGAGLKLSKDAYDSSNTDIGGGSELTLTSDKEGGREDLLMVLDQQGVYDPVATQTLFDSLYVATT